MKGYEAQLPMILEQPRIIAIQAKMVLKLSLVAELTQTHRLSLPQINAASDHYRICSREMKSPQDLAVHE